MPAMDDYVNATIKIIAAVVQANAKKFEGTNNKFLECVDDKAQNDGTTHPVGAGNNINYSSYNHLKPHN